MVYRSPLAKAPRVLDVRADPPLMAAIGAIIALAFTLFGLLFLGAVIFGTVRTEDPADTRGASIVVCLIGVGSAVVGATLLVFCYRSLATVVRLTMTEDDVTVDWRRRGRIVRSERVLRTDLVSVLVNDEPGSGGSTYALGILTRNGTITLSTGRSSVLRFYEKQRAALAVFLITPPE